MSLSQEGAAVVINDIDAKVLDEANKAINEVSHSKCLAIPGNAGDVSFIESLVARTLEKFGQLDLVVANAGITLFGRFFDFTPQHFRQVIDLNLRGAFFLTQASARSMVELKRPGAILLMSSVVGMQAYPHLTTYAMTKAALRTMARSLVLELSPHNIRINALAPGATLTDRTRMEDPDYAGTWSKLIPLGRSAQPKDIADAALFLLSKDARHITGETLVVDGGWNATSPLPESILDTDPGTLVPSPAKDKARNNFNRKS